MMVNLGLPGLLFLASMLGGNPIPLAFLSAHLALTIAPGIN